MHGRVARGHMFLTSAGIRGRGRPRHICNGHASACAFVHGFVGEAVGIAIVFAQRVADRKPIQLRNQLFGAAVEIL